jgi:hypothetical protein
MDLQEAWQTLRRQLDEIADVYGHALTIAIPIRRGRQRV